MPHSDYNRLKDPAIHLQRAKLLLDLKRPVMAEKEARAALAREPHSATAWLTLAQSLYATEQEKPNGRPTAEEEAWNERFHFVVVVIVFGMLFLKACAE